MTKPVLAELMLIVRATAVRAVRDYFRPLTILWSRRAGNYLQLAARDYLSELYYLLTRLSDPMSSVEAPAVVVAALLDASETLAADIALDLNTAGLAARVRIDTNDATYGGLSPNVRREATFGAGYVKGLLRSSHSPAQFIGSSSALFKSHSNLIAAVRAVRTREIRAA